MPLEDNVVSLASSPLAAIVHTDEMADELIVSQGKLLSLPVTPSLARMVQLLEITVGRTMQLSPSSPQLSPFNETVSALNWTIGPLH